MHIHSRVFSGEMPKLAKRNLPGNYAQAAIDCELVSQELRSIHTNRIIDAAPAGTQTLYEFGETFLYWPTDVDVIEHPGNNAIPRLFLTGDGVPKQTVISDGVADYYQMGVPKPLLAPVVDANNETAATGESTNLAFDSFYVTTFVNAFGEEGDRSEPSEIFQYRDGNLVKLSGLGSGDNADLSDYNVVAMRLYRFSRAGGSQFVADLPLSSSTYSDVTREGDLGELQLSNNFSPPPANAKGLHLMANGIALCFVGREVYVSESYQPNAWPYSFTVNATVVAISSFDNTAVILTTAYPELATIFDPRSINNAPMADREPCVSKRSVVQGQHGVAYAAPSGLYFISPGGGQMLTQESHDEDDWLELSPKTMTAAYRNGQYVAFYGSAGRGGGWILDLREPNARIRRLSQWHSAVRVRDGTDDLYLVSPDGTLELYQGSSQRVEHYYKSKVFGDGPPVGQTSRRILSDEFKFNLSVSEIVAYDERRLALLQLLDQQYKQRVNLPPLYGFGGAVGQDTFGGCGTLSLGGITIEKGVTFAGDSFTRIPPPYSDIAAVEQLTVLGDGDSVIHAENVSSSEAGRIKFAPRQRCWTFELRGKIEVQQYDQANSISAMGGY